MTQPFLFCYEIGTASGACSAGSLIANFEALTEQTIAKVEQFIREDAKTDQRLKNHTITSIVWRSIVRLDNQ